mmetsp:Transcript_33198/g.38662  ORF Transcript_33198/g.38662 Transcript_33198/m.38662 type:complete len:940 (+) Transcript_33198:46-2865(+)
MRQTAVAFARLDYKSTSKMSEAFSNVVGRKTNKYDHVVIDVGTVAAQSGRVAKDLAGAERDAECVRFVHKTIFSTLLKKVQPTKSLVLVFDGTDPLWKLRRTRLYPGRKFDSRFHRSASSPMVFALEEKLRTSLGQQFKVSPTLPVEATTGTTVTEFIISGPSTPGPAESKISQWLLDMGARSSKSGAAEGTDNLVSKNDSFCLMGGTDLFMSALGATPFHNITTMIMGHGGDALALNVQETMEWLCMDHVFDAAVNSGSDADLQMLANVRTDVVFLLLMCNGISAVDYNGIGIPFRDVMDAYVQLVSQRSAANQSNDPKNSAKQSSNTKTAASPPQEAASSTFSITRHDPLRPSVIQLNCSALEKVLTKASRKTGVSRSCNTSNDTLEILLQAHEMVCNGGIKDHRFTPYKSEPLVAEKPPMLRIENFIGHLKHLASQSSDGYVSASQNSMFALTPAESLLLSAPTSQLIEHIFPVYSGGFPLPPNVAEDIVQTKDIYEALEKVQNVVGLVQQQLHEEGGGGGSQEDATKVAAEGPHRAFSHSPTHYFYRQKGSTGPPPGYEYMSVNLGLKAAACRVRAQSYSSQGSGAMVMAESASGAKNSLVGFDPATNTWITFACHSVPPPATSETSTSSEGEKVHAPTTLTVVTWNVQFNRHSGETTPLGRAGIDWCTSTRYHALSDELMRLQADVIAMQEVEAPWWQFLSQQPWVRENYTFTCGPSSPAIEPWGVVMLIHRRLHVTSTLTENIAGFTGHTSLMPSVTVKLSESSTLSINSFHLLAPYTENHVNNRAMQLQNLTRKLDPKFVGRHCIALGDFNDHPKQLFTMPKELGFKDAWQQLHSNSDSPNASMEEQGYTIDGREGANEYCGKIVEPQFFGRADRVVWASNKLQPLEAVRIGMTRVKDLVAQRGLVLPPGSKLPEYLFPSDHFGVMVEFQVV